MDLGGPSFLRIWFFLGGLGLFLALETIRPYRGSTQPKASRWLTNLATAGFNSIILNLASGGLLAFVFAHIADNRIGLLNVLSLPIWLKILTTVVLLDLFTYVWHLLNHEVPLLWRFHRVHHADLNMDVSTATRFHLGELVLSTILRLGLFYLIGADPLGVLVYEIAMGLATQFHHSSLRIPGWLDRAWLILFVPPSLHRIHHSVKIRERDTNYGAVFSLWDRFLGTLKTDVDQDGIVIGVGGHRNPARLNFLGLLGLPFTKAVR